MGETTGAGDDARLVVSGQVEKARRPPGPRWPRWTALAIVAVAALLVWQRASVGALFASRAEGDRDQATDARTPEQRAAERVRQEAMLACDREQWTWCLQKLDEAKALDPPGDAAPRVQDARRRAALSQAR
jgi:hypothetical protein